MTARSVEKQTTCIGSTLQDYQGGVSGVKPGLVYPGASTLPHANTSRREKSLQTCSLFDLFPGLTATAAVQLQAAAGWSQRIHPLVVHSLYRNFPSPLILFWISSNSVSKILLAFCYCSVSRNLQNDQLFV